jgi:hypothetical protein
VAGPSALGKLKQENLEFKANLGYIVRNSKTNKQNPAGLKIVCFKFPANNIAW